MNVLFPMNVSPEALITPEQFAEQLCDDLDLPASQFMAPVASQIRQQCEQFTSDLIPDDGDDRRVVIKVKIVMFIHCMLNTIIFYWIIIW